MARERDRDTPVNFIGAGHQAVCLTEVQYLLGNALALSSTALR